MKSDAFFGVVCGLWSIGSMISCIYHVSKGELGTAWFAAILATALACVAGYSATKFVRR